MYQSTIKEFSICLILYKMNKNRGPGFTHFGSIPFIRQTYRSQLSLVQQKIIQTFQLKGLDKTLRINNPDLFHLTISMLTIPHQSQRTKTQQVMEANKQKFIQIMRNTKLTTDEINYFTYKSNKNKDAPKTVSVIYLDLKKDKQFQKLSKLTDLYIRTLLKQQIIVEQELRDMYIEYDHNKNMFFNKDPHITLFRCQNLAQSQQFLQCYNQIKDLFMGEILQCDCVDISTRWNYDETRFYTPLYRVRLNDSQIQNEQKLQQDFELKLNSKQSEPVRNKRQQEENKEPSKKKQEL